jgi:fatty-acyl-CoA synthase
MRNQGLGSWPARRARMTPDRTAVLAGRRSFSYQALAERVGRLANALCGLGVAHGDRVCYLGPNDPAFLETLFARGALGAIFVPLNFRLSGPELEFIVADAGATVLVDAAGACAELTRSTSHKVLRGIAATCRLRRMLTLSKQREGLWQA